MEETKKKNENTQESPKLSPESTVIITVIATLGTIVLARALYFIITGM